MIEGYEAPIHRSLWERILTAGVPRLWFITTIAVSVFMAFIFYSLFESYVAVVPLGVGAVALVGLKALTWWDHDWDAVLAHSLRYRSFYDAG
jgi:type IV secretory pathway TrbD component